MNLILKFIALKWSGTTIWLCLLLFLFENFSFSLGNKKGLRIGNIQFYKDKSRLTATDTIFANDTLRVNVSLFYDSKAIKSQKITHQDDVYIIPAFLGEYAQHSSFIQKVELKKQKETDLIGKISFFYPQNGNYSSSDKGISIDLYNHGEKLSSKFKKFDFTIKDKKDTVLPPPPFDTVFGVQQIFISSTQERFYYGKKFFINIELQPAFVDPNENIEIVVFGCDSLGNPHEALKVAEGYKNYKRVNFYPKETHSDKISCFSIDQSDIKVFMFKAQIRIKNQLIGKEFESKHYRIEDRVDIQE